MLTANYDLLGLYPGERLLDLGCGFGRHAFDALRRGATVTAFDYALDELREVNSMFEAMNVAGEVPVGATGATVRGDAQKLPFGNNTFDRIIASEVLEHLPDDVSAMSELARVLRPGGTIAISVPAWLSESVCWKLSSDYYAPRAVGGHLRIYRKRQLIKLILHAGLEPTKSHHAHALHTPYWWLKCIVGLDNNNNYLVRTYHRLLTWDITKSPIATQIVERILNPILGKSIVIYARKPVRKN